MQQKPTSKILSLLLAVCLMLTLLPVAAYAGDGVADSGALLGVSGRITAFAELPADVAQRTVERGTAEDKLNLPDELTVTVTAEAAIADDLSGEDTATDSDAQQPETQETETTVAVSGWTSDPAYGADTAGKYTFTPTLDLPEGVTLAEDVTAPEITITVTEAAASIARIGISPMAAGDEGDPYEIDLNNINTSAVAETDGYMVSNGGTGNQLLLSQEGKSYRVFGTTTTYGLWISADISLTLDNATISTGAWSAIELYDDLDLNLLGSNSLTGSLGCIEGNGNSDLTISGAGSVSTDLLSQTATVNIKAFTLNGGTVNGRISADTVNINGGAVNAASTGFVSSIQAANGVTISGGTVSAVNSGYADGISSGTGGITITGGSVYAAGIAGPNYPTDPQPTNGSGSTLYMTTLVGLPGNTAVTNLTAPAGYGFDDMKTDAAGKLYLWLPDGEQTVAFTAGSENVSKTFTIAQSNNNLFAAVDVNTDVSDATTLKTALQSDVPSTINVTANIGLTELVTMGASHTLIIGSDITVTASGDGRVDIGSHTLTVSGGRFVSQGQTRYSLLGRYGTLNLENITVAFEGEAGGGRSGIQVQTVNVGNGATVTVDSAAREPISLSSGYTCTVSTGGAIAINNFWDDGLYIDGGALNINGGTVTVDAGQAGNRGIYVGANGTLKLTSGALTGTPGSMIRLRQNAKIEGMGGKLSDQNHTLAATGEITVGAADANPSADGLSQGMYYWNDDSMLFAKHAITVGIQPQNTAVTAGSISETLTVAGTTSNNADVSYQWWETNEGGWMSTKVTGANSDTFNIPSDLAEGSHYYYCVLSAAGCEDVQSATATVTTYSGGNGSNGSGSGSSSSGSSTTSATTTPEKKPNQPVTGVAPVTATAGANGAASASVPEQSVTDAIAKAQADAKAQGKTANGISVAVNVTMPQGATSLTVTLTQSSLNSLVSAGVTSLEVNGAPVSLGLDLKALQEIQKQSGGNISIHIAPAAGLSAQAQALIGNRPVYSIAISTVKDGKTVNVTSLGSGTAALSIPYAPASGEAVGYLFGVYVDANGNPVRIDGSAYDANAGAILIPSNHFSVYGVGYTAPSAKFTDISTHWGRESIDYVVGRGLLSGTAETAFAPDTAMTRGMLVTALGRLAGVDVKAYTTNSFTDVTPGSAFQPYIEWAYKKGVVQGIGNGKFEPDRAITREEIAVIFANYAKATGYTLPVTRNAAAYADASSIGSGYKTAVTAMQQAGIMMGGGGNKFNPKSNATRAEVSSMLHRYIKLTIDPDTAQGWALNDAGQYLYCKDGKALTGTQTIDGVKYFFNTDGSLKTGWVKDDAGSWRFYSGKTMPVGFWDLGANGNNKTYYFSKDGIMVAGKWLEIAGKWYYFYADGSLAMNTKIDEYEVDENGARITK